MCFKEAFYYLLIILWLLSQALCKCGTVEKTVQEQGRGKIVSVIVTCNYLPLCILFLLLISTEPGEYLIAAWLCPWRYLQAEQISSALWG